MALAWSVGLEKAEGIAFQAMVMEKSIGERLTLHKHDG